MTDTSTLPYAPVVNAALDTDASLYDYSNRRALTILRVGTDERLPEARAWARQASAVITAMVARNKAEREARP